MTSSFNFQSARFPVGQNFNGNNTDHECRLEFFLKLIAELAAQAKCGFTGRRPKT